MSKYLLISILTMILIVVACSDDKKPTQPTPSLPAISVQDDTVIEGGTALFEISLSKVTDHIVTFSYETLDGTAKAGTDYTAAAGSDTIPIGDTAVTVLVSTIDDAVLETAETFSLLLNAVAGATVADGIATCTINDNETAQVSFATQVRPLLQGKCAWPGLCHATTSPGGELYIDAAVTYTILLNATGLNTPSQPGSPDGKVIQPGNSATSTLYTKTTNNIPFPYRMPRDPLPYLSQAEQNLLRDWIDQGALDN